jgi:hypothetical protein
VPSWAKGVIIDGCCYSGAAGTSNVLLVVSYDGTTFESTGYNFAGIYHAATGVSPGTYGSYPQTAINGFFLSPPTDNLSLPILFTAQLNTVVVGGEYFACRSVTTMQSNAAPANARHTSLNTYLPAVNKTIKTLRFFTAPALVNNSWLRVTWIGASAEVPQSNAIAEAPQDGGEYVRVSGVWRLKHQSFVMDGATNFDISVPPGAKVMQALGTVQRASAAASALCARASWDGTTFPATASDYHSYVGWIQYSGGASPGMVSLISTVGNAAYLTFNNDAVTVTDMFDWRINIIRPASGVTWSGLVNGMSYQTAAANLYNNTQHRNGVMHTNAGSVLDLKKFRFFISTGAAFGTPSTLYVTWVY